MSLINDALKRAKEAQQQAPPPPPSDLQFRPVEPAQQNARRGLGLLLPAALAVVALLTLLFIWHWAQKRDSTRPTEVNARTARVARATPAPQPLPVAAPAPASVPSPVTDAAATVAADAASAPTDAPVANPEESEATNAPAMTAPPPPKPAPLRLQAIVFNPRRPSAMISGKTLFIGDKLGDLRVVAIDQDSATLAGAGQTNVLSLATE